MAEAGARFETYVRGAMQETGLPSLAELARRTGIAASAWHGWFRGDRQPRRNSLALAAPTLGVTPEQLSAAWHGEARPPRSAPRLDPVADAIARQTDVLTMLVDVLRPLSGQTADDVESRLRALEAEVRSHHAPRGDVASPERPAPLESEG